MASTIKNFPTLIADELRNPTPGKSPLKPNDPRRLLIQRFTRFELKDLGYDDG